MRSWKLTEEDAIGILTLDEPGTEVNVLTTENLTELKDILRDISKRSDLQALLIASAKPRIFIAGADIKEIQGISTKEDAFRKAEQGKEVFQILEDLKIPTVTVINGACLGGGYELALSTKYRTASFSSNVKIGLPEVNLGILPGFGGSIRLPRLLGLVRALPLILAGKIVSAQTALKTGMVDQLFPESTLLASSVDWIRDILKKGKSSKRKKKDLVSRFFEETPVGRALVFQKARKDVLRRSKGFYPAPLEIIELLRKTYGKSGQKPFRLESEHFANLGATEVSKNLIKLFFLSERYKKLNWAQEDIPAKKFQKCGVLGAGVMGGGIAQLASHRDLGVRVKDIQEKALGGALKEARRLYQSALKRKKIKKHELERKMGLISVGTSNAGLKTSDIVIEAVVEDLGIKQKVFKEMGELTPASTILASNTSSLSLTKMAEVTKFPERVIGLHFFNPVNRMPLVEIIRAAQTSDKTLAETVQFARLLGKTVIVVQDSPGFLVNRLLLPYLNEAAYLMEEGVPIETIDRVAEQFGMPMGPVELVDQVGIDVAYKVAHILEDAFGERMKVCPILERVKGQGLLGKKSGRGFYLYDGRKKSVNPEIKLGPSKNLSEDVILKRLIYTMINEAARCLEEKIIDSPATVDIGMIFGTGFPPFRGGLLHYADSIGLSNILKDLQTFQNSVNQTRFEPAGLLTKLAGGNAFFYSAKQ